MNTGVHVSATCAPPPPPPIVARRRRGLIGFLFVVLRAHRCDAWPAGIKDFMCELCGKTFSERTTLETHKLIHTGKGHGEHGMLGPLALRGSDKPKMRACRLVLSFLRCQNHKTDIVRQEEILHLLTHKPPPTTTFTVEQNFFPKF